MTRTPVAYALDGDLNTRELGPVSLDQAIGLLDERLARAHSRYGSGEEALRETMFGFSRDEDDFIELCIHAHDHVACSVELPSLPPSWWRRVTRGSSTFEVALRGRQAAVEMLTAYFTMPEHDFATHLKGRRA